jgi:hypothetical protein
MNSLEKLHGKKKALKMAGMKVPGLSTFMEEKPAMAKNRSITIQKDQLIDSLTPSESFEVIVEKIAKVNANRRKSVENALIGTGSKKVIRNYNLDQLNAEVHNRLTENTPQGQEFRNIMTMLVVNSYGNKLVNDGFFRNGLEEEKAGADLLPPPRPEGGGIIVGPVVDIDEPDYNYTETTDGGASKDKQTDWGSILSGGAQVIDSVGGVIGLFTGGSQSTEDSNVFTQTNYSNDQPPKKGGKTWIWVVLGLVVVSVVLVLVLRRRN